MQSTLPHARYWINKKGMSKQKSRNSVWLFKGSKTFWLYSFLQAVAKVTANYDEDLRIEHLEP